MLFIATSRGKLKLDFRQGENVRDKISVEFFKAFHEKITQDELSGILVALERKTTSTEHRKPESLVADPRLESWSASAWRVAHYLFCEVFDKTFFIKYVDFLLASLASSRGCKKCKDHFKDFTRAFPPKKVENALEATVWFFLAHNEANAHKGGRRANYAEMRSLYNWPSLSSEELKEIHKKLARKK